MSTPGSRPGPDAGGLRVLFFVKGARVYVSGLLSIAMPFYLSLLGYNLFFQGVALAAILAGGAISNIALSYFEESIGRVRLLQVFSLLMVVSGLILAATSSALPLIIACLMGNISTTGTEAGPFQSVEAGLIPELVPPNRVSRAFGAYNLIGYSAAAAGTLTSTAPVLFGGNLFIYRVFFIMLSGVGVLLLVTYSRIVALTKRVAARPGLAALSPSGRSDVVGLSALFSLDAFGGAFVSQYLLSTWFRLTYGLTIESLGAIFFVSSVTAAASAYGAALVAERLGNLRTMVYTHLVSNAFLLLIPFAGFLAGSLLFLFLRQSMSQMDVPTRQALMTEIFTAGERVPAYAVTNVARTTGSFVAGPVAAGILGLGFVSGLLFAGGGSKVIYDLAIFARYRRRYG